MRNASKKAINYLRGFMLIVASLALLLIVCILPQGDVNAASGPTFSLSISDSTLSADDEFQVTVNGTEISEMYAYEVNIIYDTSHLNFVNGVSQSNGFAVKPIVKENRIQIAHTQIGNHPGLNGNVTLATLTFKVTSQGSAEIALTSVKMMDSNLVSTIIPSYAKVTAHIGNAITPEVSYDSATKTVTSIIDAETWKKAINEIGSDSNGNKTISIDVKEVLGAQAYVQQLPSYIISSDTGQFHIKIKTPLASIVVPSDMFHGSNLKDEQVGLRVGLADTSKLDDKVKNEVGTHPVIELSVQSGNKTIHWNNPKAPVNVSIPYSPTAEELKDPEHVVVWYIDGKGEVNSVPNGKYNPMTGQVTFSTTHFSTYAVSFVLQTFEDISSVDWAKKQIEVLASKGIINGTSDNQFSPTQSVTRADFLVLLARTLDLQGTLGGRFADVEDGIYYDEALRIARGLGITNGSGEDLFFPNESITREDMMVLTERALRINGKLKTSSSSSDLSVFTDVSRISDYAVESIASLVKSGLINGYDGGIHPKGTTTRAEAATLMYNIYNY